MTDEKYHWNAFKTLTHKAYLHLDNIYHSPYEIEYWGSRHGLPFIAELYRQGKRGEDPVITYKRLNSIGQKQFCDEMFDACRHFVNWDFKRVWKETRPYANQYTCKMNPSEEGWYRIAPENCPENYGFNAVPLSVPQPGSVVEVEFRGEAGREDYNSVHPEKAGWRYGFVAVTREGESVYGEMENNTEGVVKYVAPKDVPLANLWLVVMGAPTEHWMNPISGEKDAQWPYKIKITGSFLLTSAN